ncbi:MAG: hypothetical protein KF764_28155 [Labilithrix sp.]|nr:hypothetical protein [Labilithrix sp.]
MMNARFVLAALGLCFGGAAGAACDSSTGVAPSSDAGTGLPDGDTAPVVSDPSLLDAGGPLSRPLSCPGEGIVGEPFPDTEIFEALRTAAGLDFLERRAVYSSDAGLDSYPPLSLGTPCGGAADAAACTSALAALSGDGETLYAYGVDTAAFGPKGFYFVYTKADAVGKITNVGELRTVLPSVDSPVAALMYVQAASYRVMCTRDWYRQEPDGFVVLAESGPPCRRNRVVLFVRADGTIEERDSVTYESACL